MGKLPVPYIAFVLLARYVGSYTAYYVFCILLLHLALEAKKF